jgi:error-prone DNA polymerase
MTAPDYAELHCLSNFTFLRGASHPGELVDRAVELGYRGLAITDECSMSGVVRAYRAAKASGLQLLVGTELRLPGGLKLVLLCTDRTGYGNLCELITQARRQAPKGQYRIAREALETGVKGCLILWLPDRHASMEQGVWVSTNFRGRAWIGVELLGEGNDRERLDACRVMGRRLGLPLVAGGDVHMHRRGRRALQDTLTSIRLGVPLNHAGDSLFANGERHLRPRSVLAHLYPRELLSETVRIAGRCQFSLEELRYEYPEELVPVGETPTTWLRCLTEAGLDQRWPDGPPASVRKQAEHELSLIAELAYEPYFLTVYDIVAFARRRGILCQGRGSAANSAVCYCLGITEVDPARMDMLFERFMSRERDEPPDIDVDFEHDRREEVIQYVYEKYGRDRAALAATVISYRERSALRDVAKALDFDPVQITRLTGQVGWDARGALDPDQLRAAGFDPDAPPLKRLCTLTQCIRGFPRHLSQHVGGFVISRGPLCRLVPVENAAMEGRTVIQWDKDDLDTLGLLKVDCLALGMLSAIRRALDDLERLRGRSISMATLPAEDAAVYDMICKADTMGVFQIESRAQMSMLPRLKPRSFYDLVIEVAIVRPGPIQGGMVHPYLRRRAGKQPVRYPNEAVREVLKRTLGVPIFQEQVMQLAVVAAGFTPGEADQLRRAMAAWRRPGDLEQFRRRFVDGMLSRGYKRDFAQRLFRQIQGFGEYGFPESHAASFALLVYVSAWLKCHEPAIFCCALLNSQPMGFYAPSQLVQDARRQGVEVRPVSINESAWDCTLERIDETQLALRLGLRLIKGLSRTAGAALVSERCAAGPYTRVDELRRRVSLSMRDLEALAHADALLSTSGHRRQALWQVLGEPPDVFMGRDMRRRPEAPVDLHAPLEGQEIAADFASLGLSLRRHPLALLRDRLGDAGLKQADQIKVMTHGERVSTAGLVINRQRPSTAGGIIFATLEDESGYINVVIKQEVSKVRRRALLGARLMQVDGTVEREGRVVQVLALDLKDLSAWLGDLQVRSRDFH